MSKKGYTLVLKELQQGIDDETNERAWKERENSEESYDESEEEFVCKSHREGDREGERDLEIVWWKEIKQRAILPTQRCTTS